LHIIPPSSAEGLLRLKRTKISESLSPILKLFRIGLKEDPDNLKTRVIMAKLYIEIEKPALALHLMRRVMQLSNNKANYNDQALYAQSLYEVAMEQRCERPNPYFDEALNEAKAALAIKTDDAELELILASLYSIREAHTLSLYTSKRLYERQPIPSHKLELADRYWFSGDNEKAIKLYKSLFKNGRFREEAYRQSGRLMFGDGNWKLTKKYLQKYLKLVKTKEFYPTLLLAIAEERLSGKEQMAKRLKQIPKSQADSKWKQTLLGYHLGEINEHDFISMAENVCEKTEAHYFLGLNHLHQGDKTTAINEFKKVIDLKFPLYIEYRFAKDQLARIAND
jgi:tetratricopeptide (TPR) repeat protein